MPELTKLVNRYRESPGISSTLWFVIALGIVPAIASQNISPLDIFSPNFGIDIKQIRFLPGMICLLIFIFGAAACAVQKRYWMILLLLPWLALSKFTIDDLTSRLPGFTEVQEKRLENHNEARGRSTLPNIDAMREKLDQVVHTDQALLKFDADRLHDDLDRLQVQLDQIDTGLGPRAKAIEERIKRLSKQIDNTRKQIDTINKAMATLDIVIRLSWGIIDKSSKTGLRSGLKKVTARLDRLIAQRSALRAELGDIGKQQTRESDALLHLLQIDADITTQQWLDRAYENWYISLSYKTVCFLVLLVIIWRFSLGSRVYLTTVGTALAFSLFYVDAPLSFRLWVIAKYVIISLIIRAFYLLFTENYPLLRRQSMAFILQTLKKTLVYYLPFVFFIGLGIVTTIQINSAIDRQLYSIPPMVNSDEGNNTRRYDIDVAIDAYFEAQEIAAHKHLDGFSDKTQHSTEQVAQETVRYYENTFKPELKDMHEAFEVPDCSSVFHWMFKTGDCLQKEAKQPLASGYRETRDEQLSSLRDSSNDYKKRVGDDVELAVAIAKEDLSENFEAVKRAIKIQLSHIYTAIDFYSWLSLLVMIVLILKSLMYIFARIFFASGDDERRVIQFEPAENPEHAGSIREIDDRLTLDSAMGKYMYVNKEYDFANAPPDEVTPQAASALVSRFKNGVWHMNKIKTADPAKSDETPYRRIPDDERVVAWTLKPGDAVIFSWKTFVGMSDSIRIRARYSWQLSSLVFGRMFYVVASVDEDSPQDGTLLLVARGSDGIRDSNSPSNSPDQLLAWQTTTRFRLHASLTFRNVYRSGIQIKARDSDLAVMHLSDRKGKSGAAAFLKYFLVPV